MFLSTGNFESGLGSWRPLNSAGSVTTSVISDVVDAKHGIQFMRFKTTTLGGSVAHDVRPPFFVRSVSVNNGQAYAVYGPVANSLQFSVWLRSAPGQGNVQGSVALWDLDANVANSTTFNIGPQWTQVSAGMDRASTFVRAEIYLYTINQWLDADAALLI